MIGLALKVNGTDFGFVSGAPGPCFQISSDNDTVLCDLCHNLYEILDMDSVTGKILSYCLLDECIVIRS